MGKVVINIFMLRELEICRLELQYFENIFGIQHEFIKYLKGSCGQGCD